MATRTIQLRRADARDIATIDALMKAAFDPRFGEAWTRGQAIGVLALPGVRATLALVDDVAAGFAMVRGVLDEAELLLIAVDPAHRRRGIATALLRAIEADCAADGIADLHLEVRADNDALRLYAAHGFVKVGERRAYYRGPDGRAYDAHTYRRALP